MIIFLAVLFFVGFIARVIFAPLMPTIEQELGVSHTQAGSLFLMMSLGFFVAQLGSGVIASRINHRGTIILSALAVGLALLPFLLTRTFGPMRVVMIALGLATGLHMPSAIATITAMVARQDWGKALAVHATAPSLSLVLAPILSEALLHWYSWQTILASLGGLSLLAGVAFIGFGRCGEFPGEAPRPSIVRAILVQPSFWIMMCLFALAMGGSVGTYTMLPLYLVLERGLDRGLANTLLGLSRISGLFMNFAAGWIADRVGEKRAISGVLLTAGVATILLGTLSGSWLVAVVFLQAALVVCYFPPGFAAMARVVPPNLRSVATSLATPLAFVLGGGVVPAVIGYMGEVRTFGFGIALIGCIMVLGSMLALLLRLREQQEEGC
jgi:NNP family nitrate/nitrite transporter-like MFS transporter